MSDDRPRPRYGEYATPQEQAEIVARSMPPVSPLLTPADQPTSVHPGSVHPGSVRPGSAHPGSAHPQAGDSRPGVASAGRGSDQTPRQTSQAKPRAWDRILSLALLGYGLFTVVTGLFQYADLASVIQQVYDVQGIGTFTATPSVDTAGVVLRLALVVVWIATALLTVPMLRAGRIAFYIPLIGGAVMGILMTVILTGLLIADPTFMDYVTEMQS